MPFNTIEEGILYIREKINTEFSIELDRPYISLMGNHITSHTRDPINLDTVINHFTDAHNEEKILLLYGDPGSGKTLFCQKKTLELWQDYINESNKPIPLFISLAKLKDSIHHAIEETLENYGFTQNQIGTLKKEHHFIFIFDGYDEIHQSHNLYMSNRLSAWRAKTIITSRHKCDGNNNDTLVYFMPLHNEREHRELLTTIKLSLFNDEQIQQCLEQSQKSESSMTNYPDLIARLGLQELIKIPLFLQLTIDTFPNIVKKHEACIQQSEEFNRLVRTEFFDMVMEYWFERQETKLKTSKHFTADKPDQKPSFWRFSQILASTMNQYQVTQIDPSDEHFEIFFDDDLDTEIIRSAAPLIQVNNNYQFIYPLMLNYFATKPMRYEPWEHNTQLLAAQKETKLQPNLLEAPSGFIHLRFIIENPSLLNLLAEQVENDPKFKKWMFELLKYSKKDKRYAIGASNAISALNAAKVSFSGTNLREVKIPYANLDGAVIDSKDLSDSDLTGVSFRAVWLRNSNLQRACLKDVQFGQCPLLLHKEQVSQILFSPNGQYLAISAGHLIYLWRNNGELCHTLEGHKDAVNSIDFSLNSALLASGSNDKTVRLWEISTGKIQYIFEQHEACISKVIFSPDGKTLASCDGAVRLWNIHDKKLSLESNREYGDVKDLAFSANGEILAFSNKGMLSARLDLYHISSKRLQSWNDEISTKHRGGDYWDDGTITRLMFNQNQHSPTLAFINQDCKTIFLWDVLNKETPAFLKDGHLADMAFHPKNDIFAYSTTWENSQVHLYDLIGKADSVLKTEADVQSLVFSDDGQTLALSSTHNTVEFWDIPSKKLKTVLKGDVGRGGNMAFSPDGGAIAVLSNDNAVRLFALDLKSQLSLPAPLNASKTIMARTDHELVVLSNGAIQLKNIISGQLFFTLHVPGFEVSKSHLSADGKTLACINSNQGVLQLWDMVNGKLQKTFSLKIEAKKVFHFDMSRGFSSQLTSMLGGGSRGQWEIESPEKNIIQVYFGSNNKIFAVTLSDKEIELRDLESGKVNFTLHHHDFGKIERVVFSPDKQNFVYISGHDFSSDFGSFIHTIHLYGRINDQLKEQHLEEGQKDSLFGDKIVYDVIFSPAGDVLASVWRDAVKLWNIATGKLKYFWERECHIALFSPNGQLFAVDNKHTIELWNILAESEKSPQIVIDTGEIGRRLKQGIFSSDSQYLIAFNVDSNTPWLWNHSKQHLFKLEGHTKKITSITIGFDNKIFISGSDDCTLRLWNECGECLAVLEGYLSPVKSILWQTHDTLVTNDEDGDLKCWRIIWQSSHSITCQLTWRDSPSLFVKGSKWDQSVGLSPLNYQLLQENGIVGELILDVDRAISSQKSITVFGSQLTLFSFIIPDERTNYFYGIHVYFCHKKDKKLSDYITCLSDFKELILALKKDVTPSTLKYYLTSENSLKHTNLFKENRYHSLRENLKNYDLANLQKNFNEYITYLKQQVNRANGSASYEIASQLLIAQCQVTAVTPSENNEDEKNAKTSFASRTSTPSA